VSAEVVGALLVLGRGPGKDFLGFQIRGDVDEVAALPDLPHARQIRLAIRRSRSGRGQVGFAVWRSRHARRGRLRPLSMDRRGREEDGGEQSKGEKRGAGHVDTSRGPTLARFALSRTGRSTTVSYGSRDLERPHRDGAGLVLLNVDKAGRRTRNQSSVIPLT